MPSAQHTHPTFLSVAPRFVVQNMEQALAFYRQLGFQTSLYDEHFGFAERDGVTLHLQHFSDPPEATRSAGSRSPIARRCINSICQPVPFARLSPADPGGSRNFASGTPSAISFSLMSAFPRQMRLLKRSESRQETRLLDSQQHHMA